MPVRDKIVMHLSSHQTWHCYATATQLTRFIHRLRVNLTRLDNFTMTLNESLFSCCNCGCFGMVWRELSPGRWLPFDHFEKAFHRCRNHRAATPSIKRAELINQLFSLGFTAYIPRCTSWQLVLAASNLSSTLYFMVAKSGLDFRVFDTRVPARLDDAGKLYMEGGEVIRNRYRDALIHVHGMALDIANRFSRDECIQDLLALCRDNTAAGSSHWSAAEQTAIAPRSLNWHEFIRRG